MNGHGLNVSDFPGHPVLGGSILQESNFEWELTILKSLQWIGSLGMIPCVLMLFMIARVKLRTLFNKDRCDKFINQTESIV